ncbi:MAG: hypothetical protein GY869_32815 [Planctomycetes bacterium]|nr:hypothetical protein [Planctomycetota bacterium]
MGTTSIAAICTTIKTWIDELDNATIANGLKVVQNFDELTEGMNSTPAAQVYWNDLGVDSLTNTTMQTLQHSRRNRDLTFNIDIFTGDRNHLHLNMAEQVRWADLLWDKLEEQDQCYAFSDPAINIMNIEVRRVLFDYATVMYPGVQAVLTVRVF